MTALQMAILAASYLVGAIPFSHLIARSRLGVDLRTVGTGTATPMNLRRIGGVRLALAAGMVEMAKGAAGPMLIGTDHRILAAVAGALAITGHNWSPFLRGGGGRGISAATGALWVVAWPGAVYLGAWLAAGTVVELTAARTRRRVAYQAAATARAVARTAWSPETVRGTTHTADAPELVARTARNPETVRGTTHTADAPELVTPTTRVAAEAGRRGVLPAMRLGLFTLLPFLVLLRGFEGLAIGVVLITPIGFKTTHEIHRRQLLRRTVRQP